MPRRATGTLQWSGDPANPKPTDHWMARLRAPDENHPGKKRRPWVQLEPGLSEDEAREIARRYQRRVEDDGLVVPGGARGAPSAPVTAAELETLAEWVERFLASRLARGKRGVRTERGRAKKWIVSRLGHLRMAAVTREQIEAWVEWIDGQVVAEKLAWKSAQNAWMFLSKMFVDASRGKVRALKVRDTNPTRDVQPPERGTEKLKQYLYPSEFLTVAADPSAPLPVRRCYAVAIYLCLRAGELHALAWEDVDLEHGTVHVHRAVDADTGETRETKGRAARRFQVEPALLPLLRAMRAEAPDALRVFDPFPLQRDQAHELRGNLLASGVTRPDLYANDDTRRNVTFHDLRATGVTWAAVRGDEPLHIMHRAGHKDLNTTLGYVREAENVRRSFGVVFPELPACLLGDAPAAAPAGPSDPGAAGASGGGATGGSVYDRSTDVAASSPNTEDCSANAPPPEWVLTPLRRHAHVRRPDWTDCPPRAQVCAPSLQPRRPPTPRRAESLAPLNIVELADVVHHRTTMPTALPPPADASPPRRPRDGAVA
ncbi:MAG: hypothetical protein JWM10_4941 [Myxococcaceae bacterium]|nr:hypothetical protein [Myxococcaceae bacterium]